MVCSVQSYYYFLGGMDLSSSTKDWTLGPQQWKCQVLTTGLPGNFQLLLFKSSVVLIVIYLFSFCTFVFLHLFSFSSLVLPEVHQLWFCSSSLLLSVATILFDFALSFINSFLILGVCSITFSLSSLVSYHITIKAIHFLLRILYLCFTSFDQWCFYFHLVLQISQYPLISYLSYSSSVVVTCWFLKVWEFLFYF